MAEVKNGMELLLTMQLAVELMDEYKLKGNVKRKANMFRQELKKVLDNAYDTAYAADPKYMTNALNYKHKMISAIAELSEPDALLLASFVEKFYNNIDEFRSKGVVEFDNIY